MKRACVHTLCLSIFCLLSPYSRAQYKAGNITLPAVAPANNGKCKVFAEWKPSAKFLRRNPDFLKDGNYHIMPEYMAKHFRRRKFRNLAPHHSEFSSAEFPAVFATSDKKVNAPGKIYLQVSTGDYFDQLLPLGMGRKQGKSTKLKKEKLSNRLPVFVEGKIPNAEYVNYYTAYKDCYENLDHYCRENIENLIKNKFASPVSVSPIGSAIRDTSGMGTDDLVFQFEFIEAQSVNDHFVAPLIAWLFPVPLYSMFLLPWNYPMMFSKKNSGSAYPSNLLLKLHVKSVTGREIRTYGQVVFVKEKHRIGNAGNPVKTQSLIFAQALPVAMESLIDHFLEDSGADAAVKEAVAATQELAIAHPALMSVLKQKVYIDRLENKKTAMAYAQSLIDNQKQSIEDAAGYTGNPGAAKPSSAGAAKAQIAGDIIGDVIVSAINKKQIKGLNAKYDTLAAKYHDVTNEENAFKKNLATRTNDSLLADRFINIQ